MDVITRKTTLLKRQMKALPRGLGWEGDSAFSQVLLTSCFTLPPSTRPVQSELRSLVKSLGFFLFHPIDIKIISYQTKLFPKINSPSQESFLTASPSRSPGSYIISQFNAPDPSWLRPPHMTPLLLSYLLPPRQPGDTLKGTKKQMCTMILQIFIDPIF